jgi:putative transposase
MCGKEKGIRMKKRTFSVEQKVRILREAGVGMTGFDIARKHNINEQTFNSWKKKYGGMGVSEERKLRAL